MKPPSALMLALAFGAGPCASPAAAPDAPLDLCHYELAWSDEFDTLSVGAWGLEGKRWIAHTPWAGDFGDARFADPGRGSPFSIRRGKLVITARRDAAGKWTSGLIAAADETGAGTGLRYGYFETRMHMSPGPGTWPAFWLFSLKPRNDPRPNIELDALEYYGHDPAAYQAAWHVHYKPPEGAKSRGDLQRIEIPRDALTHGFHTVGIDVGPKHVTYYFDRRRVWQHPTPEELDTPLFPLVNLALGSGYSIEHTPNPSRLEVDYVRLYRPRSGAAPKGCPSSATEATPD